MTKTELNNLLSNTDKDFDYSAHEQLVHLTCVFENDVEEFEVTFAVPFYWTMEQTGFNTWERLQHWLQNEYTSDDSKEILDNAILENKIAFWKIN